MRVLSIQGKGRRLLQRTLLVVLAAAGVSPFLYAVSYPLDVVNNGETLVIGNGDEFTDSGGAGAFYSNDEDFTVTLTVPAGLKLSVDFTNFFVEDGFDFFYIFDGADVSAPAIGPPGGFTGGAAIGTVFSTGNALTFRFVSDFIVPASGWTATTSVLGGAILGNSVWQDADGDGDKDLGENGLEGVLLELLDSNGNAVDDPTVGGFQSYTAMSDSLGFYSFNNVVAGSYRMRIATPPGSFGVSSTTTSNTDDQQDDDDNGIQSVNGGEVFSPLITLADGEEDNTVDFGFVPSVPRNYTMNPAPGFDWFDGLSGVVWAATDTSKTHDITYTDSLGSTQTVTVTMALVDPDNRNGDTAASLHSAATHPFDPSGGAAPYPGSGETDLVPGNGSVVDPWDSDLDPILTETGGAFGAGFLTMGIKTGSARERVGFRFSFSKPVELSNLEIAGIDSIGFNYANTVSTFESAGDSYQDRIEVYARDGSTPVEVTLVSGGELTTSYGTVVHTYDTTQSGVLPPTDSLGTTTVSADRAITELEIYYSNGSDDAVNEREQASLYSYWSGGNGPTYGVSDDQGVRISGFDLMVADDAVVSGFVKADTNRDGVGEVNLSGVQLALYTDPNGDGDRSDGAPVDNPNLAGTQDYLVSTDGAGLYRFSGLLAGDYVVVQSQPAAYLSSSDGDETEGGDDGANASSTDNEIPVSVALAEADDGNNFVEARAGALSGSVLKDTDDDGDGDTGVEGVVLTLRNDLGEDIDSDDGIPGLQPTTTLTGGNGAYSFTNLFPADYQVVESQPAGFKSLRDSDGGNPDLIAVSVFPDATVSGRDFEEVEAGALSGRVLEDTNNDDTGENGIQGVVLTLKNDFGDDIDSDLIASGVQPTVTITDENGEFSFDDLRPNFYQIHQTQPAGFDSVGDTDGANDNMIGAEGALVVSAGQTNAGNTFVEEVGKPDSFAEWVVLHAAELGGANGLGDNADGDRYSNALEYALCLHPGSGLEENNGFLVSKDPATGEVTVEYTRPIGNADLGYVLEAADSLTVSTGWSPITSISPTIDASVVGIPGGAEKVVFENLETASEFSSGDERGVVRLKVTTGGMDFYSEAYGWQCVDYNDYELATFNHPFSKTPVFSGTFATGGTLAIVTDGAGNVTLDVSGSANGADLGPVVGSGGQAYLQVTNGILEGERFDVLRGGVDSLTLVNDPGIFSENDGVESLNTSDGLPADSSLHGASYEVIFHQTVDEVFERVSIYAGEEGVNPGDATRLLFYNNRRDNPGFDVLLLIGTSAIHSKWVYSNDLLWQVDRGMLRLDPGAGNWIQPKSSGDPGNPAILPPVRQFAFGMVAGHDQACAMNEGFNLLGAMWPFDQSPAGLNGRELKASTGFDGGTAPSDSSELLFWQGDLVVDDAGVGTYEEGYANYMLLDGGGMQNWVDVNDLMLTNQDSLLVLESHRATLLKLLTGDAKEPHFYPKPAF